uniref:Mobile element protein n=1 Tax=Macrostomum lignano TaxID=282301 RepID=A0A1I8FKC5_9PLAT
SAGLGHRLCQGAAAAAARQAAAAAPHRGGRRRRGRPASSGGSPDGRAAGWLLRTCHRRRACRYFMDGASLLLGDALPVRALPLPAGQLRVRRGGRTPTEDGQPAALSGQRLPGPRRLAGGRCQAAVPRDEQAGDRSRRPVLPAERGRVAAGHPEHSVPGRDRRLRSQGPKVPAPGRAP